MKHYVGWLAFTLIAGALFFLPCLGAVSADSPQAVYSAYVNRVYDGDTLGVTDGHGKYHKLRLASIDAPELRQPWGTEARAYLTLKISKRVITVIPYGRDKYDREIATVVFRDENINKHMLEKGLAWHYKAFSRNPEYNLVETMSKNERRGLWSSYKPTPPWVWREKHTNNYGDR